MKYKYLLFDHDGVLVDTELWYFRANQKALREWNIELDVETHLGYTAEGKTCWDLASAKGISSERIERQRELRNGYYQNFLLTENIDIEEVIPTLERLSERFKMAIVTTARGSDFRLIHRERKILDWMEFAIVREDYERSKPYPDPYLAGLSRFGAERNETLAIEDSSRGLKAAIAAGVDCVVVKNDFTASQDFSGATSVLESFKDLSQFLSKNDSKI